MMSSLKLFQVEDVLNHLNQSVHHVVQKRIRNYEGQMHWHAENISVVSVVIIIGNNGRIFNKKN